VMVSLVEACGVDKDISSELRLSALSYQPSVKPET
jgi:hypothetical protein